MSPFRFDDPARRRWRNIPVADGGHVFDSRAEHRRWQQLCLLQHAGAIRDLRVHPAFPLVVNGRKVATYIADFSYVEDTSRGGPTPGDPPDQTVIEDVKSPMSRTPVFNLKRRLVSALYGLDVRDIDSALV